MSNFVTCKKAIELLNVHGNTLRKWSSENKIQTIRTPGGQRLYNVGQFINSTLNTETIKTTKHEQFTNKKEEQFKATEYIKSAIGTKQNEYICYCRVSSKHQENDLKRQVDDMQLKYPEYQLISDIGSGINWNRKGLRSILDLANKKLIKQVVVAYRDRLCRFAFELIEWILNQNGVKLVVLNQSVESGSQNELTEDLCAIINVFNCRINGKRRYSNKKEKQDIIKSRQIEEDNETSS